mmetsp:Transcript_26009/g.78381  ORF Transcript_26009/g.78381 Transcript_26009/m.78381 type:complete len:248 (+) Transcript_26009:143-886(+)
MSPRTLHKTSCSLRNSSAVGFSISFKTLAQEFGQHSVTRMSASRSCSESPTETMLRCGPPPKPPFAPTPKTRSISPRKARSFHTPGCMTPCRSYTERADKAFTSSKACHKDGMNFLQLISIHPCSAFVTMITLPNDFATRRVNAALSAMRSSCARWAPETAADQFATPRPWASIHEVGRSVSSQSKMRSVSSAAKVGASTPSSSPTTPSQSEWSLPKSVDKSEPKSAWSTFCCPGSNCRPPETSSPT